MGSERQAQLAEVSTAPESEAKPRKAMVEEAFYAVRFCRWNWLHRQARFPASHEEEKVNPLRQLVLADGALSDIRLSAIHRKPRAKSSTV